jgi:hypothetical protein
MMIDRFRQRFRKTFSPENLEIRRRRVMLRALQEKTKSLSGGLYY